MRAYREIGCEVATVKLSGIGKHYGEKAALNQITLSFEEGEITAVLGESGAGKTTLLNVLAGLTSYEGTVDGREGKRPKRREECSYLFQEATLLPNLTAEGNLKFVLPKSEWNNIPSMLEKVGLKGREGAYPHELSGGEKQRVAVARAFLYPHSLLLMDEPFSSLDLSLKKNLIELVTGLWTEKKSTIVFVTHDTHEAALLASRALVLQDGKCVADVPISAPYPRDFFCALPEEETLVRALMRL